jgi:glycine/D-amino acid oxidase-like deaminating enzyme
VEPLGKWEYSFVGELGDTSAVGGFSAPDCVIDFPELVRNLHRCAEQNGATFLSSASVKKLVHNGTHVTGVEYERNGEHSTMRCDFCVIAMGAWSPRLLKNSKIIETPLILKKCLVLTYVGELVPCITVCLDVRDGPFPDATLVPFKGTTLAAGTDFDETDDPDDKSFDSRLVDELQHELARCFPALSASDYNPTAHVCFKTEQRSADMAPNVGFQIYEDFNVDGVLVAIPGKASLMFELAAAVADRMRGITSRSIGRAKKRRAGEL